GRRALALPRHRRPHRRGGRPSRAIPAAPAVVSGTADQSHPARELSRGTVVHSAADQRSDGKRQLRAREPMAGVRIDPTPIWPVDDARLEPVFLAGLPDGEEPDESDDIVRVPRQRASPFSPLGSFCVHLVTLLFLLGWGEAPAEIADALPVQLVFEV